MNKINFYTTKERTVIDKIPFTKEQFIKALTDKKPTHIFNSHYSEKIPCWIITEYLENDRVKYFADGWADKTPIEESMDNLYTSWMYQGLEECYFNEFAFTQTIAG